MILVVFIFGLLQTILPTIMTPDLPKYFSSNFCSDSVVVHFGFINQSDQAQAGGVSSLSLTIYNNEETHRQNWPWKLDGSLFEYELLMRILPSTYYVINKYVDNGILKAANWGVPVTIYPGPPKNKCIVEPPLHYKKIVRYSSELSVVTDADSIVVNCIFDTLADIDRAGGVESVDVKYYKDGYILKNCYWPYLSEYNSLNQELLFKFIPLTYYTVKQEIDDGIIPNSPLYVVSFAVLPKWTAGAEENPTIQLKQKRIIQQIEKTYNY